MVIAWLLAAALLLYGFPPQPASAAASISLSQSTVAVGYTQPLTVTATGTDITFETGATNVSLLDATNTPVNVVSGVTVLSASQVSFTVATGLSKGAYSVRISTPNGDVSTPFTVTDPATVALSQSSLAEGYSQALTVTATGTYTHFASGQTVVKLVDATGTTTGKTSSVTVASATSLTFNIATGLAQGDYTVRITTGGETVTTPFTVTGPASVSISPARAAEGYSAAFTVTATGTNTHFVSGQTTVSLLDANGQSTSLATSVNVASATSLSFSVGTGLAQGDYTVRITTGGETVTTPFTVTGPASISLSQSTVASGYSSALSVTATGTNTNFVDGTTTVSLRDANDTNTGAVSGVNVSSATSVTFSIATGLAQGSYTLRVRTGGETVTTPFTVTAPASASLSTSEVAQGYTGAVSVTATGTNTNFASGQTTVSLLDANNTATGKVSSVSVASATSLSFNVNTGLTAGSYTVRIATGGETVDAAFTVTGAPSISLSQSSVAAGYASAVSVTVTGTNTHFVNGTTAVSLLDANGSGTGATSSLAVTSATSLSFNIATGLSEGSYTVRIVTDVETVTAPFTVSAAPSISLSRTDVAQGYTSAVSVTVTGTNTNFVDGTTSVSVLDADGQVTGKASAVSVSGATSLSFNIATGLTQGSYTVRVVTGSESATAAFTVTAAATASLSPNSTATGYSSMTVTVTGTNSHFAQGQTNVNLLDGAGSSTGKVSGVTVASQTSLTFNLATGLAAGSYTLRIVTGGESIDAAFTVTESASMTVSPSTVPYLIPVTMTLSGVGTQFSKSATVSITDSNSSTKSGVVSNIAAESDTTLTFTLAGSSSMSAGDYTVSATAGGVTTTASFTVAQDSTAPTVTVSAPSAGSWSTTGGQVAVTASASDDSSGISSTATVTATVGGVTADHTLTYTKATDLTGTISGNVTIPAGLTAGANDLVLTIADKSGNSGSGSVSLSLDMTEPTVTISSPTAGTWYKKGDLISVSASVSDDSAGIASAPAITATVGGLTATNTLTYTKSTDTSGTITGTVTVPNEVVAGDNQLLITIGDRAGNEGYAVAMIKIDPSSPTWPQGRTLTAGNVGQTSLTLTWTQATDDVGVTQYKVYRNSSRIATVDGSTTRYDVTGLKAGLQYTFKVEAGDAVGNFSTDGPSASAIMAGSSATAQLSLVPSAAEVDVGTTFTVDAMVANVENLAGMTLYLTFDATKLQVADVDAGTDGVQIASGDAFTGKGSYQVMGNTVDNDAGTISFTALVTNGADAVTTASASLATVTFTAAGTGAASIGYSLTQTTVLGDANGANIPIASFANTSATISSAGTISGQVTLEEQNDSSGILVEVRNDQGTLVNTGTTAADGSFAVAVPALGTYSVTFKKVGWSKVTRTGITVSTEGENVAVPSFAVFRGDMNLDGAINVLDLILMAKMIGTARSGESWDAANANGDGAINVLDLILVAKNLTRKP